MPPEPLLAARLPAHLVPGIECSDRFDRLTLRATRNLTGIATGLFAQPSVWVTLVPTAPGVRLFGWSFAQFAWPVRSAVGAPFEFNPTPNVHSPPAVLPLLADGPDGEVELLAPLDAWHEQIVAVDQADKITGLRWGWHGDLDTVPEGFITTLGRFRGTSAREVLARWGHLVRNPAFALRSVPVAVLPAPSLADATPPLSLAPVIGPDATTPVPTDNTPGDPILTHLSYWTDNGAAYWYRTEPGLDMEATLTAKLAELAELGVPVGAVELDSWFYPHEVARPVGPGPQPTEVPPTGMLHWSPRTDVLPGGMEQLHTSLGAPPLVLHSRHISPASPYVTRGEWWTELSAVPADPAFYDQWFADAARWGATCVEQDWLLMVWYGARQVRSQPGRARAQLAGLDRAARRHGLSLLLCMALPGDYLASVELSQVIAVRTSDDYRIAADPAHLWVWYLSVNLLADSLGLAVFKDCFLTGSDPGPDGLDGDPYAGAEALLAVMSAGVVGIGDRLGRTDPALLARVCRPDGLLVKPDRPISLHDQRVFTAGRGPGELCWADTATGPWRYLVALHVADDEQPRRDEIDLGRDHLVYDWRRQEAVVTRRITAVVDHRDWALFVCCPLWASPEPDGWAALIGDPTKYATMSRQRVSLDDRTITLKLSPGEPQGTLRCWSSARGLFDLTLSSSTTVQVPVTSVTG